MSEQREHSNKPSTQETESVIQNKNASSTDQENTSLTVSRVQRQVWGASAAMRWANKAQSRKEVESSEKATLKSVAKRVNKQIKAMTIIKRWAHMTSMGQFAKDDEHLNFIREATRQSSIDIPAPIQHCIREETFGILQDTLKQYRVELGARHRLTEEMQKNINEMRDKIATCTAKENRKSNFLKRLSTVFMGSEHNS